MGGAANTEGGLGVNPDPVAKELLEAVLAAPADDGPRLVYADHLLERGDVRGEYIIAGCMVARLEKEGRRATAEYRAAKQRERQLFKQKEKVWFRPSDVRKRCGHARGFARVLGWTYADVRRRWEHIAAQPLATLSFVAADAPTLGELAWLMRTPTGRRLESVGILHLRGRANLVPALLARQLAETRDNDATEAFPRDGLPHARIREAVHSLALSRGAPSLFDGLSSGSFPALTDLMLEVTTKRAVEAVRACDDVDTLGVRVTGAFERPLFEAVPGRKLHTLRWMIGDDDADAASAQRLAGGTFLDALGSLSTNVPLTEPLAEAVQERAREHASLDIYGRVEAVALARFATGPLTPRLKKLALHAIGPTVSAAPIARANLARLDTINLARFDLDASASSFGGPNLVDLTLRNCTMNVDALVASRRLDELYRPLFEQCALDDAQKTKIRERWPDGVIR